MVVYFTTTPKTNKQTKKKKKKKKKKNLQTHCVVKSHQRSVLRHCDDMRLTLNNRKFNQLDQQSKKNHRFPTKGLFPEQVEFFEKNIYS
jgi:hypothetical protein